MDLAVILTQIWKEILDRKKVVPSDNFFALGGNSIQATAMILELEKQTGIAVPISQIYITPVLSEFAEVISQFKEDDGMPLFIPIQPKGTRKPLFAIAPAKGGIFHFRQLADCMPENQPFYVIEPRVSVSGKHVYESVQHLAKYCLKVIRQKQPQGPYRLTGYSFGGIVAWEIAVLLEEEGERVDMLVMLDSSSRHNYPSSDKEKGFIRRLREEYQVLKDCINTRRAHARPLRFSKCMPLLKHKLGDNFTRSKTNQRKRKEHGEAIQKMHVPVQKAFRQSYVPRKYGGPLYLFRASQQLTLHREIDLDLGWGRFLKIGKPEIYNFQGDHFSMVRGKSVVSVVNKMLDIIETANHRIFDEVNSEVELSRNLKPLSFAEPVNGESLNERFHTVVATFRDKIAIRDGGVKLSFGQFSENAHRIAAFLENQLAGDRSPILLHFETSWQFLCSMYGILLTGRCYVPVDTEFPDARTEKIIQASGAKSGISLSPGKLEQIGGEAFRVFSFNDSISGELPRENPLCESANEKDPAALLFTSGSTGEPKGVSISREMMLHVVWRRSKSFNLVPADRYGLFYVSAFMGALISIHTPLLCGVTCIVYNIRRRGIKAIPKWMQQERISVHHMITSLLRNLLKEWKGNPSLPDLRILIPGGEASRASDLELWKAVCHEKVKYCGALGSTECGTLSINPLTFDYEHPGGPIPVGKPYQSLGVRILREDGSEADCHEEGEIVVESHYIFRGYHNNPELTKKVLTFKEDGKAVYRTGDYGYFDEDGILYNAGRKDSRVKVNGTLVEIPEVESAIMASGLVAEAVVLYRQTNSNSEEKQLVAFYRTTGGDPENTSQQLSSHLLEQLTKSMIPSRFIALSELPRTPNGKTDRQALQEMKLD